MGNQFTYTGGLKISVLIEGTYIPIKDALVEILSDTDSEVKIEELQTDSSGQTEVIDLPTPELSYSLSPDEPQPYSLYNIVVRANGYQTVSLRGTQVLPDILSLQNVYMTPLSDIGNNPFSSDDNIVITPHSLYGNDPDKLPESEIKPIPENGEIVLSRVVIPEYVVVHDGIPTNSYAQNYYVKYKDYIKNVASSEIYATWPEATIYANILCIMSFTLNRIYSEWYKNKGFDFTITSSTAFDQKWIHGRNIYDNIDFLVDSIFNNYLSRPGVVQPIFTSYCDGNRAKCSGLSQWGSKALGDEGYSAIQILRYYYGNDIYINTAEEIDGVPASYPGTPLSIGSRGQKVLQLQRQLNRISQNYPAIPKITADSIYGTNTADAVKAFQRVFSMPITGTTDFATWYAISDVYVGVTKIAEPL